MSMDVTDVLRDRTRDPRSSQEMMAISASAILHAGLFTVLLLAPDLLIPGRTSSERTVMTITLGGGAGGPDNGGMTSIGGRPVQALTPPDPPKRPEPVRPPAAKTPEMTLPAPRAAKPRSAPSAPVKDAPPDARGRTPTRGSETSPGSAVAETGARGLGFGLSTGGAGSGSRLDVADFCCPDYIVLMIERIRANWNSNTEASGETMVKFTIQRDGTISDVILEKSSGYTALDLNARRALLMTKQLPALPAAFPNPTLPVHLNFQYIR
jgi:protein TonB